MPTTCPFNKKKSIGGLWFAQRMKLQGDMKECFFSVMIQMFCYYLSTISAAKLIYIARHFQTANMDGVWNIKTSTTLKSMELKFKVNLPLYTNLMQR